MMVAGSPVVSIVPPAAGGAAAPPRGKGTMRFELDRPDDAERHATLDPRQTAAGNGKPLPEPVVAADPDAVFLLKDDQGCQDDGKDASPDEGLLGWLSTWTTPVAPPPSPVAPAAPAVGPAVPPLSSRLAGITSAIVGEPATPAPSTRAASEAPPASIDPVLAAVGTVIAPSTATPGDKGKTLFPVTTASMAATSAAEPARAHANASPLANLPPMQAAAPTSASLTLASAAPLVAEVLPLAHRQSHGDEGDPTLTVLAAATTGGHLHAVAGAAATQGGALDMRGEAWPHAMIDRIDALRDAANAVDTSIRLHPDALGTIDVNVRRHDDAVHVQLSAEQAATRQLLAEAQPRLSELAAARGIRLAHSGVDAGTTGQFAQPGRQQHASTADRPAPPTVSADADTGASDDLSTRIA